MTRRWKKNERSTRLKQSVVLRVLCQYHFQLEYHITSHQFTARSLLPAVTVKKKKSSPGGLGRPDGKFQHADKN